MTEKKSQDRFLCYCGEYPSQLKSWIRRVCFDSPFYKDLNGNRYCIFHYPGEEKRELFEIALEERIKQERFHFEGVWFPSEISFHAVPFQSNASFAYSTFSSEVDFSYAEFYKSVSFDKAVFLGKASFSGSIFNEIARFDNVTFEQKVNFEWVKFDELCKFTEATFKEVAEFEKAKFNKDVDFSFAEFNKQATFRETEFSQKADFSETEFKENAIFRNALFKNYLYFSNENESYGFKKNLDLEYTRTEQPEKIYFHSINIRPHWFINIDTRKFNFINTKWVSRDFETFSITKELKDSKHSGISPDKLLKITFRQLAVNAEENNRFEEASSFRRMALEAEMLERKEERKLWFANFNYKFKAGMNNSGFLPDSKIAARNVWKLIKFFPSDILHFLYRIFSGYGERWFRAFCWLIAVWLFWAFLYATPICDFIEKEKYSFSYWIGYSLNVITLQRPEPKPANSLTMIILGLEVLFAPLQAALLILAVRRKFIR
jgi:uncharacterized protein YjbI with pentapeptide repeats